MLAIQELKKGDFNSQWLLDLGGADKNERKENVSLVFDSHMFTCLLPRFLALSSLSSALSVV